MMQLLTINKLKKKNSSHGNICVSYCIFTHVRFPTYKFIFLPKTCVLLEIVVVWTGAFAGYSKNKHQNFVKHDINLTFISDTSHYYIVSSSNRSVFEVLDFQPVHLCSFSSDTDTSHMASHPVPRLGIQHGRVLVSRAVLNICFVFALVYSYSAE